jgi:hypothetical protein
VDVKDTERGVVSPRKKMQQLASRVAICTFYFVWITTACNSVFEYFQSPLEMLLMAFMDFINGLWGPIFGLIIYAISFTRPSTGEVPAFTASDSRRWYTGCAIAGVALGLVLGIHTLQIQSTAAPPPASVAPSSSSALLDCTRLHGEKSYEQSIDKCNAAAIDLIQQQMPRFRRIMKSDSPSKTDIAFALAVMKKMLVITNTLALDEAKLNQPESGRQSALKAVGWTLYIAGVTQMQDPKLTTASSRATIADAKTTRDELERLYPGVIAAETKVVRERSGQ